MSPLGYRVAVRTAAFLFVAMACQPGQAATFHVSPDGRDTWSGSLARPNAGKAQLVRRPSTLLRPVSLSNPIAHARDPIAESHSSEPPRRARALPARFLRCFG